ncbi:hypothetical protein PV04_01341 [Phialophora macrospora]|uniref:Uncharacterized protein n=1 Tax=Phialophora macrospora TaxID=1851006 RepID=A0A0D2EFT2_9EURO|nr:hypothetical protein PV04_01341 [Phialophora macrospora]
MSVSRQVSEEWIPFFYRPTTIVASRLNQPSDFGNLYLKTLDHYKLRHIRKIAYVASPSYRGSPEFAEMKAFVTVVGKFMTELHSLAEVKLHARYTYLSWLTWSIILGPDHAAMMIWEVTGWNRFARSLQGRTRFGVLRGWNAEKEASVLSFIDFLTFPSLEMVLKLTKPENLDGLMAEGPAIEVYKLSFPGTGEAI